MKIIEGLEQGSEAWLAYRRRKITATDTSALLKINPWSSPQDIYNEKFQLVPPKEVNSRMLEGQLLEPEARALFIDHMKIEMVPAVVESIKYPFMMASLDGISNNRKQILEIKVPSEKSHLAALDGVIAEYYKCQMQKQLLVTGAEVCYYFSYRPLCKEPIAIIMIWPKLDFHNRIIEAERDFYEDCMLTMTPPVPEWTLKQRK